MESNEIIINEIAGKNDWFQLSRTELTIEQIREFKDKVDVACLLQFRRDLPLDILEDLVNRINSDWDEFEIRRLASALIRQQNVTKELYLQYMKNSAVDITKIVEARQVVNRFKITPREAVTYMKKVNIGEGATVHYGSDSHPYTVIEINKSGLRMKIQSDKATKKEGYDYFANQVYDYQSDPNGDILTVYLNKDLKWKVLHGGSPVSIGGRRKYQNPSF